MELVEEINVSEPWFSYIKNSKKTIEGRLAKGKFLNLTKGQIIKWTNENKYCKTKIIKIVYYKTFEEYLVQEGLKRTLPEITSLTEAVNIYYQYYTKEQENQYGIMAIYLKRI